jgi:hypothetical protein
MIRTMVSYHKYINYPLDKIFGDIPVKSAYAIYASVRHYSKNHLLELLGRG